MDRRALPHLLLALLVSPLLAAPSAHATEEAEPLVLDAEAGKAIRGFLDGLEADLLAHVKEETASRQKLMEQAIIPELFATELDEWTAIVKAAGAPKTVMLTGVEVQATTWFGLLALWDTELFFWVGEDRTRLLRFQAKEGSRAVFGNRNFPAWRGQPAESFGVLADQVLRASSEGHCESLPVVAGKDYKAVLPKKKGLAAQTREYLDRMKKEVALTCRSLVDSPLHRVTWRLSDVAGVVETKAGDKLSFRLVLVGGPAQDVMLYHVTRPVSPRTK